MNNKQNYKHPACKKIKFKLFSISKIFMKYNSGRHRSHLFHQKRRGPLLPVGLIIVLVLLGVFFWLIPTDFLRNSLPINVSIPTFTPIPIQPTVTRTPRPVNAHGGTIVFTCTRGQTNHLCAINADGSGLSANHKC